MASRTRAAARYHGDLVRAAEPPPWLVALLTGAAEGFALLANLQPPPYGLAGADVPEHADLVVIGNPTDAIAEVL